MKVLLSEKVLFQSLLLDLVSLDGILSFIIVQKVFFGPLWNPLSILSFSLFNLFFLNNLFCCLNSEISILWYIINLIKLQILKHLQKRKMVLSLLLNVVILHVIFRCLWRQCQVLIYFCVLIVYLHIIEILSHLPLSDISVT